MRKIVSIVAVMVILFMLFNVASAQENSVIGKEGNLLPTVLVKKSKNLKKVKKVNYTLKNGIIKLNWKRVSNAEGYNVYKFKKADYDWHLAKSIKECKCNLGNFKEGESYLYKIVAFTKVNNKKVYSKGHIFNVLARPKATSFWTTRKGKRVHITWKQVNCKGYYIYKSDKTGKNYKKIKDIKNGKKVKCTLKNIKCRSETKFRVVPYVTGKYTKKILKAKNNKSKKSTDYDSMENGLRKKLKRYSGSFSVYVSDLNTGESIFINRKTYYAASIIKAFVMASLYDRIEKGYIKETSYIKKQLKYMITVSDNAAYNRLVSMQLKNPNFKKGAMIVNKYLKNNGYMHTTVSFPYDTPHYTGAAHYSGGIPNVSNRIRADECGKLMEKIYNGTCVSKIASKKMLKLLKAQKRTYKIPAGVPKEVVTANKTGEINSVQHDMAIVWAPKTTYVICVLSAKSTGSAFDGGRISKIRSISKYVYNKIGK